VEIKMGMDALNEIDRRTLNRYIKEQHTRMTDLEIAKTLGVYVHIVKYARQQMGLLKENKPKPKPSARKIEKTRAAIREAILKLPNNYSAKKISEYLIAKGVKTSATPVRDYRAEMICNGEFVEEREVERPLVITYKSSSWNPSHDIIKMSNKAKEALVSARFF